MKRVLLWVIPPIWVLLLPFCVHKEKAHIEFYRLLNSSCNTQYIIWFNNTHSILTKLYMLLTYFPKNINRFLWHKILSWFSIILFLPTWNTFWGNIKLFCWHEAPFRATSTCFCWHQITFCATSNVLSRHKNIFRATLKFCFGPRLECYVIVIYFYCHVATNI